MKAITLFICVVAGLVLCSAGAANAQTVDWGSSFVMQGSGIQNPLIQVGFNPQPEPPYPWMETVLNLSDPVMPTLTFPDSSNPSFRILFGFGTSDPVFISAPGAPDSSGHFEFNVFTEAQGYNINFDLTTSSGGVPDNLSWVGFNPQPEPPMPVTYSDAIAFDFDFTSMSVASLSLQVQEEGSELPVSFTVVPEPISSTLFIIGGATLGYRAFRRRMGKGKMV